MRFLAFSGQFSVVSFKESGMAAFRRCFAQLGGGAVLLLLFLVPTVHAQDPTPDPVLPDIAPREVEIRGDLQISLPSLQRQPLVGFNPPPRVTEIPPSRVPFMEPYRQGSADMPTSPLSNPLTPNLAGLTRMLPLTGFVEGGLGRYSQRFVNARIEYRVVPQARLHARFSYEGTGGQDPFNDPALSDAYDVLEGGLGLSSRRGSVEVGGNIGGFSNSYSMFGAEIGSVGLGLLPGPDRDGQGGHFEGWVRTTATAAFDAAVRVNFAGSSFETVAFDSNVRQDPTFDYSEQRLTLSADAGFDVSSTTLYITSRYSGAGFDGNGIGANDASLLHAGTGLEVDVNEQLNVKAGAHLISFSAVSRLAAGLDERRSFITPLLLLKYTVSPQLRFYAQNLPQANAYSLADLYEQHPYLVSSPDAQASVETINARVGGNVYIGPLKAGFHVGLMQSPNYLYFDQATRDEAVGFDRGFSMARYDDARILEVGGDLTFSLLQGLHTQVRLVARQAELTDLDVDIPYVAPFTGAATLSYLFAERRGLLQITGTFENERYLDAANTQQVNGFFDLDIESAYNFTPQLGLLLRLENITSGDLERFDNYPEPPAIVTIGARYQW